MFIRPVSDIHNEFSIFNLPVTEMDSRCVLILAGDIALADRINTTLIPFLDSVTDRFADIMYIPGNHEFYHSSLAVGDGKLEVACKRYANVHYMQNKSMVIGDVRFIGSTLWTDFNNGNPIATMTAQSEMNDFNYIRTGSKVEPYERKIRPIDMIGLNHLSRSFITSELKNAHEVGEKAVLFTHHGISMMSCTGAYPAGPMDYAYYNTGMENMILDYEPVLCVHGHSHHPVDYMLGNTRIVNNARGYTKNPDGNEGLGYRPDLVIEV